MRDRGSLLYPALSEPPACWGPEAGLGSGDRQGGKPCLSSGAGVLVPCPGGGPAVTLPHLGKREREAERSLGASERIGSL